MNWATLIEADCDKDIKIKDPTPKPEVQASPVILARVSTTIISRRKGLDAQLAKMAKKKAKAGKAKTDKAKHKADVAVACDELRVKARAADLELALNRWKNLEPMAKSNLEKYQGQRANLAAKGKDTSKVDETIASIEAWLHFGGKQSGAGQEHLGGYSDENFKPPPLDNVSYDFGKNKVFGPSGEEFDVVAHVAAEKEKAATATATAVLEPPPEPKPAEPVAKSVDALTASELAALKTDLKAAYLDGVSKGTLNPLPHDVFKKAGVATPVVGWMLPSSSETASNQLWTSIKDEVAVSSLDDLDMEEATKLVSTAMKIVSDQMKLDVAASSAFKKVTAVKAMRTASAGVIGKVLGLKPALAFIDQARDKWYSVPKPLHAYTPSKQSQIKGIAKSLAIESAFADLGHGPLASKIKDKASTEGLGLSAVAASELSMDAVVSYTNLGLEQLNADQKQAVMAVAKKAVDSGKSVHDALKAAGIVHLNKSGMKQLQDEVGAKPDEAGFLKEIEDALDSIAPGDVIPLEPAAIISHIDQFWGMPFIGLMSKYHIEKVKGTKLENDVKAKALYVVLKRWNPEKLIQFVHDEWDFAFGDKETAPGEGYALHYVDGVFTMNTPSVVKLGGWPEAIKEITKKHHQEWLAEKAWPPWSAKWDKDHPTAPTQDDIDNFADWVIADPEFIPPGVIPSGSALHNAVIKWAEDHLGGDMGPITDAIHKKSETAPIDISSDEELGAASISINATETGDTEPKPLPQKPALPTVSGKTKVTKISKPHHLTGEQKKLLDGLVSVAIGGGLPFTKTGALKTQLGSVAGGIAKQFKDAHLAAGTKLTIGKPLVQAALEKALVGIKHSDWLAYETYKALSAEVISSALTNSQLAALGDLVNECFTHETYQKKEGGGYYGGPFKNKKQKQLFNELISKCEAVAAAPTVPEQVTGPAGAAYGGSMSVAELFGMSKPDLDEFASLGLVSGMTTAPPIDSSWTSSSSDLDDSGGSQGSTKKFLSAALDGKKHTGAGAAPAQFLFKHDGYRALGEAAANRVQSLLGLGGVGTNSYVMSRGGKTGFVQFFRVTKNLRHKYGHGGKPWLGLPGSGKANPPEDERKRLAQGLQLALVGNWLIDDKDDHGGNFVFDESDQITGIDHGQCCKFFDSGGTLLSHWDWSTGKIANKDGKATLEANKGWPKRMLYDWAAGADLGPDQTAIPLLALTDPAFEKMIQRAEGIPDDVYDKMWRPYAEGAVSAAQRDGEQRLSRYSHNPKDRTVEGFLDGMQKRRKSIRKQVAELYSMLAKKRAQALAAHGDTRPLAEIEADVREQLGLDKFAAGAVTDKQAAKMSPLADEIQGSADAPGWDESKLPESSHVPTAETIAEWGVKGYDMAVGGDAIKDGRVTFRQVGEIPMVDFRLDNQARAALQSRLPGYSGGSTAPPKPAEPYLPPFTPPPKPTFNQSNESLGMQALTGGDPGGMTGLAKGGVTGDNWTKVEKYVSKHYLLDGGPVKQPKGSVYWLKGLKASRDMKLSADPVVAAAGAHYEKELLKFGEEGGEDGFVFKAKDDVPEADRTITPFKLTPELKKLQDAAKADVEAAHAKSVEEAKAAHEKEVEGIKDKHAAAMVVWQEKYDAWSSGGEAASVIKDAVKYPRPQQPIGAKQESAGGKAGGGSKWDGSWGNAWYAGGSAYEIDLTDAVTQLGGVATGEKDSRFVIRYNTGKTADVDPKSVSQSTAGLPTFSGKTTIQFPKGSNKEQMRAMMKRAFEVLGIDARPASEEDHELNYVRKMAWLLGIEGAHGTAVSGGADARWHKVEPAGGTRRERIDFWIGKLKKKVGYDPRYAPQLAKNGTPKTVPGSHGKVMMQGDGKVPNPAWRPQAKRVANRVAHRRFDYTDEAMIHQLSLADPHVPVQQSSDRLGKILQGTMMSSAERTANGILTPSGGTEGSASADAATGGGLSVFLYNRKVSTHHVMGTMGRVETRMVFHPSIHLYTNTYAVPGDSYGSKVSKSWTEKRHRSLDEERLLTEIRQHSSGSAETMAMDQIDIFHHVLFYKLAEPKRSNTIKKLKKAGIDTIGMPPRPVEEVIVSQFSESDMKAVLKASAKSKEWS